MDNIAKKQAYWLLKKVDRAIREFEMIEDGDRVAVALSGGKDSLALLTLLDLRRQSVGAKYDLVAIHVRADGSGADLPLHEPLMRWLQENHYEVTIAPLSLAEDEDLPMGCHRCTWNRRRALFEAANRLGCRSVAFGHHADDLAQTTLLNLLYHGSVETMEPRRDYFGGVIRLIRPLCYVAEKDIRRYGKACGFPEPPPICPQGNQSRRRFVRDLIQEAEKGCKDAKINLLRAGLKGGQRQAGDL